MAVPDDLRRLSDMDSIYLGWGVQNMYGGFAIAWYKGRLQQANDGNWLFRSISLDGSVVGFQLGPVLANWSSNETPSTGITVTIPMTQTILQAAPNPSVAFNVATVNLRQQVPQELTN